MFNNPFLKKDSLVEAVRQAQVEGDLRRQAEALVNEEFGVYSRKAVVREQLAAYDAALEEAYKCMKEGEQIDEISGKLAGSYMTKAREQKKEIQDKVNKGTATRQEFRKGLRRTVGMEVARDKLTGRGMAKVHTKEELADKDYDKDGKIESPKDEVWGSRFRAAKMAGKMEEEQIDEISRHTLMSYRNKAAKQVMDIKKKGWSTEKDRDTVQKREIGHSLAGDKMRVRVAASYNKGYSPEDLAKHGGRGGAAPKNKMDEAQIDEVSKKTAISAYREKMAQDRDTDKLGGLIQKKWGRETAKHAYRAGVQDTVGLVRRGESHGTDRLASAKPSSEMRKTKSGKVHKQDVESKKSEIKFRKSMSKFDAKRGNLPEGLTVEPVTKPKDVNSSPNPTTADVANPSAQTMNRARMGATPAVQEAVYSAKAARAGKDIGKPGPGFEKIAKKAGKRYGSAERGRKVAGAILKKIRAKHMKENADNE